MTDDEAEARAYARIERIMNLENASLTVYAGMPEVQVFDDNDEVANVNVQHFIDSFETNYVRQNIEQRRFVDDVRARIDAPNSPGSNLFFLDGPAGTGKTFVLRTLIDYVRSQRKQFIATAFTGIAASLMPTGRTSHSVFKLPVPLLHNSNSSILPNTREARALIAADVIFWDEISMSPKYAPEVADRLLRSLCNPNKPFGGKVVVFSGDFRQCLPVRPMSSMHQLIQLSCKNAEFWPQVQQFKLAQNMRADADELEFANTLLDIGCGRFNDATDFVNLPDRCVTNNNLATEIFRPLIENEQYDQMANCAILAPHHARVNVINDQVLNMLPGDETVFESIDTVADDGNN